MALAITIPFKNTGVSCSYWNLGKIEVDFDACISTVTLHGYLTKEARLDGKRPISKYSFTWRGADNPITRTSLANQTAFGLAYAKVKMPSLPFMPPNPFEGAEDD